jgi:tetratricopeptide (TPR) repeat protein
MRRWTVAVLAALLASAAAASDLKATLSADKPEDRAILRYLERAEAKTATSAELTELGVLLASTARLADAEHWLREAVKLDKHSFAAAYRLGLVQQRQGNCSDAARSFAHALREKPDDPYARFMLAVSEERCGRPERAIDDYAMAYAVMPELADAEKNPLVLDSRVQTEASLAAYGKRTGGETFPLSAVDPDAVKAMMAVEPPATPAPTLEPGTTTAAPVATPVPETIPVATPTPAPGKPPASLPPGAPGGPNPRKPPTL